jgi:hypothetical protein
MSLPDLITTDRAVQNAALAALQTSSPDYLASLITAASDIIRRRCNRAFVQNAYTEYYSGGIFQHAPIRLRQFPVLEVTRVAASPQPALRVMNLDSGTNQRATVETTASGLTLFSMASGTPTAVSLAYATYPTIGALAGAINILGSGWSATVRPQAVTGDFSKWPSADFKPLQGAVSVLVGGACLEVYCEDLQPMNCWPADAGDDGGAWSAAGWRLDAETGELFGRFPRGQLNIRIDYSAGFVTVPQPIQEATVQLVQDLYQASLVNNTLQKATLGASSIELKSDSSTSQVSGKVQALTAPYIDHSKMIMDS